MQVADSTTDWESSERVGCERVPSSNQESSRVQQHPKRANVAQKRMVVLQIGKSTIKQESSRAREGRSTLWATKKRWWCCRCKIATPSRKAAGHGKVDRHYGQ